jgi:hypothetical protein
VSYAVGTFVCQIFKANSCNFKFKDNFNINFGHIYLNTRREDTSLYKICPAFNAQSDLVPYKIRGAVQLIEHLSPLTCLTSWVQCPVRPVPYKTRRAVRLIQAPVTSDVLGSMPSETCSLQDKACSSTDPSTCHL